LGQLNVGQIQPFLDELAWREKWGRSAGDSFDNVLLQLANETKITDSTVPGTGSVQEGLIARLSKIASAPMSKWLHQMVAKEPDEVCHLALYCFDT
jgi:hypothetical protein